MKGRNLDNEKIDKYLKAFSTERSQKILDKLTIEQEEKINKFLERPLYSIKIQTKDGELLEYTVSSISSAMPELKIEKKQHIIIKAKHRVNYLITDRNYLQILAKRESNFRIRRI